MEIKDPGTNEVVARKTFEDGFHQNYGFYLVNTTQTCTIRITVNYQASGYNQIFVAKPGGSAFSGPFVDQNINSDSQNVLVTELDEPGEWIIRLYSIQQSFDLQDIMIETDATNPC